MLSDVTTPQDLDERFREAVAGLVASTTRRPADGPVRDGTTLTGARARALFDAQLTSRHLDLAARWLRSFGEGYYTIGSSGHEGNAAVAAALAATDPALLHYRSGGFYCARAAQAAQPPPGPDSDPAAGSGSSAGSGLSVDSEIRAGSGAAEPISPTGPGGPVGHGDPTHLDDPAGHAVPNRPAVPGGTADPDRPADQAGSSEPAVPGAPGGSAGVPERIDGPGEPGAAGAGPPANSSESAGVGVPTDDPGGRAGAPDVPGEGPDLDGAGVAAEPAEVDPAPERAGLAALGAAARDVLRGIVASAEEPIAGGRHKVFGNADLAVIPTTSTVASHLPRAVGIGFAIERQRRLTGAPAPTAGGGSAPPATGPSPWPADAIVVCSFGDASVNHASATAALNTAGWCDHTGLRVPVLFVCEDNGLGISVRSPAGWVAAALRARPGLRYFAADGCDLAETYDVATEAAAWVRRHRRPAVLHLTTVRLMGHAGADAEQAYRPAADIARDLARDPVLATARLLVEAGLATAEELLARYDEIGWQVRKVAEEVLGEAKLESAAEIVGPLAPRRPVRVSRAVAAAGERAVGAGAAARAAAFGDRLPEHAGPLTLAQTVNAALADGLLEHPTMAVFGEDVAAKGGVYGVTKGLREKFGPSRVFDTLLDETSILGLGLGAGLTGMLPVPEIQYLAYLHNAEDQLRGEAATMRYFSRGAYRNPMVLRVPGLAYQEGFGGHFHNDNSLAVLRDVPGLVLAVPARADDAAPMLRTCLASAAVDGSVCVVVEPIALYHTHDLYADGDDGWLARYVEPAGWGDVHVPIGRARTYPVGSAEDITIITFGNGVRMSLRAAARLAEEGIGSRVVDLRWLAPLPLADLVREASATGRVLVVDETRRSGGVGEGVLAALVDAGYVGVARRVASIDTFVPLGPAARQVLVSEEAITQGAQTLLAR
ncbi:transketolase C-terminal domain-containing protein [Micromonospora zhanjiangensis]|uniref:Transketolase C-terminal domain-containing protein n=1 Tax=Micromonospora zhanjiangensis TaxID=1522057 RepID=A0ABV8KI30_9ACTN